MTQSYDRPTMNSFACLSHPSRCRSRLRQETRGSDAWVSNWPLDLALGERPYSVSFVWAPYASDLQDVVNKVNKRDDVKGSGIVTHLSLGLAMGCAMER